MAVRFYSLELPYFRARGTGACCVCGGGPPTLHHLLCLCPGTQSLRVAHGIPTDVAFLRCFLLGLDSRATAAFVRDFLLILDQAGTSRQVGRSAPPLVGPPPSGLGPRIGGVWEVYWDGSF